MNGNEMDDELFTSIWEDHQQGVKQSLSDLNLATDKLETEIGMLVEKASVGAHDVPILAMLLNHTQEPKELKMLAKALYAISGKIAELKKLKRREMTLNTFMSDRSWFSSHFANNLDNEVDNFLRQLGKNPD